MPRAALLLGAVGVVIGLAAETAWTGWRDPRTWLPDLAVGWVLIGSGALARARRPASRTGWLLAAAGVAWFLPNFASLDVEPLSTLSASSLTLHQGPLIHAVLSFPTGRLHTRSDRTVTALAYVTAVVPALAGNLAVQAIVGGAVITAGVLGAARSVGPMRRARSWAIPAALAAGIVPVGVTIARHAIPGRDMDLAALTVYQVVLIAVSIVLLTGLLREPWTRTAVTDLVVELGDAPTPSIRDALARALGDPTLEVGYALDSDAGPPGYVDPLGRPVRIPATGTQRAATHVELDGRPGILVHDRAVLDDAALVGAVAEAARLAAVNARLQGDVRGQIAEVEASRRRLVDAEDDARRRIQVRLREGTEARLAIVEARLDEAHVVAAAAGDTATLERTEEATRQLTLALEDLRGVAQGLHPPALQEAGLRGAVVDLAERATVPIEVDLPTVALPRAVASAGYFVCAEAITNIGKHAHATRAIVRGTIEGQRLRIEISDDGVGGADATSSGLRGLADRVETLGGTFSVTSGPGTGTRLTAELPLDGEA